ncbi:uncharacterized protein LOC126754639 [Bactrocera neohumeralis]|uniref:uncharacterized protein LOC126754639 n=1 Tax=Bactrocera neohumeralis TaxID=98809 RepID=UPI0021656A33|nr:uncharacterized protein LOC126754639 [Bactrocera neohumeralis]
MHPIIFLYSSSESEEENVQQVIRNRMRDKNNPLALPEAAFRKRFRLSKSEFNYLLAELKFEGHLSTAVAPMIQLGATLSLLASVGYQHLVGNDFLIGICQSTICKIIKNVISEMETKLCPQFIKFVPDIFRNARNRLLKNTKFLELLDVLMARSVGCKNQQ